MKTTPPTVYIIDDEHAIRDSLALMIAQENIPVMAFESAQAFLEVCPQECSGCAIIDYRMPEMDGLELQAELAKRDITLPIIFLTGHGNIPTSVKAVKAGAIDFLTKPVRREKLISVVVAAMMESEKILAENASYKEAVKCIASLTEREYDVMLLAIQGYHNKDIARQLGISHRTVEIHKSNIMHKTGASHVLDLARIAHKSGLKE
ncbi:DNA-binding response regulator [Methylotenera oryzisoli]|uniref:DNA-binding response regulator n=1 Tax=Methylotenera oryzisoli TaxID=2080758 RepID=A0A4Y9VVH4_9PROT|nr:response regulator [Methylotenera oryzisoli]TFW73065.1 DNA-binding response regulator [Methylotenera oryzisoli]